MTPTQSGFTRPVLSPLLLNPIELSYAGTLNDLSGTNGGNWETMSGPSGTPSSRTATPSPTPGRT